MRTQFLKALARMTLCWRYCGWKLRLVSSWAIGGALTQVLVLSPITDGNCALAQITPDGTLGAESSVVTPSVDINGLPSDQINGGATRGANLFHSFREFNIGEGRGAYFTNPVGIENILSRVTGGNPSRILGTLGVLGNANLFLINPNGIIFGQSARLDVRGSLVVSTASSLNFADSTQFSATSPQATPLLTVSVPIGLQFGGTRGSILNQSQATNSSGEVVGLQVQPSQTLALVGGDVNLDGGILQTPGGRVELGGIAEAGRVGLNIDSQILSLSFPPGVPRTDVSLTNQAEVRVVASGGGSIVVNARNLEISGQSEVLAGIGPGMGSVDAQAGNIEINATDQITITGQYRNGSSGAVSNTVERGAMGNGGDINITTGSLSFTNGAQLVTIIRGKGNAGSVTINARDAVSFDGVGSNSDTRSGTGAFSTVQNPGEGQGGDVNISTGSLSLTNGAQVAASTSGRRGNAGTVTINARDTVFFDGVGSNGSISGAFSRVAPNTQGRGGNINITTGSLLVTNGGKMTASTFGQGDAGIVTINARDAVYFDGVGSNRQFSGAFSKVEPGAIGNGGGINITTGSLWVTNDAELSASSEGSGAAGNIEVAARSIRLDNEANLSSNTTGGQGNISLRSGDLVLRRGSNITTNATGTATGGNINIRTDVIAALVNSDISANAQNATGGRVIINAQGIFGTQFRNQLTSLSDITASSNLGPQFSGTVEINTLDIDPSRGLVNLPTQPIDTEVVQACTPGGSQQQSEFVITGRGGLPPTPREALGIDIAELDWVTLNPKVDNRSHAAASTNLKRDTPAQIVEAQGWIIGANGEVVLTANAPTVTPHSSWQSPSECRALQSNPEN